MNILSIDTSTALASVALASDERLLAETLFPAERCLSARLMPEIQRLLDLAGLRMEQIELFAAAIGPGSFTGVRAGVATIQGLALAMDKPCAGFSTLSMLAMGLARSAPPVCPLLDARKSEVYGALYDCTGETPSPRIADSVLPPAVLLEQVKAQVSGQVVFVGEGALRYRPVIESAMEEQAIFAPLSHHAGRAACGIPLALEQFRQGSLGSPAELLPVYIRPSEAELARKSA